ADRAAVANHRSRLWRYDQDPLTGAADLLQERHSRLAGGDLPKQAIDVSFPSVGIDAAIPRVRVDGIHRHVDQELLAKVTHRSAAARVRTPSNAARQLGRSAYRSKRLATANGKEPEHLPWRAADASGRIGSGVAFCGAPR